MRSTYLITTNGVEVDADLGEKFEEKSVGVAAALEKSLELATLDDAIVGGVVDHEDVVYLRAQGF